MINLNNISVYQFTGNKTESSKQTHKGYSSKDMPNQLSMAKAFIQEKTIEEIRNSAGMYTQSLEEAIKSENQTDNSAYYRNQARKGEDYFVPKLVNNTKEFAKYCTGGKRILNEYVFPNTRWNYADIGVDEKELIKDVAVIKSSLNLRRSALKNTGDIKYVGGDLVLDSKSQIEDLSSIKTIKGSVVIATNQSLEEVIKKLKKLQLNLNAVRGTIITIPPKESRAAKQKTSKAGKLDCTA